MSNIPTMKYGINDQLYPGPKPPAAGEKPIVVAYYAIGESNWTPTDSTSVITIYNDPPLSPILKKKLEIVEKLEQLLEDHIKEREDLEKEYQEEKIALTVSQYGDLERLLYQLKDLDNSKSTDEPDDDRPSIPEFCNCGMPDDFADRIDDRIWEVKKVP